MPAELNDIIRQLAKDMYDNGNRNISPILADALEDAGFTRSQLLLTHLRCSTHRWCSSRGYCCVVRVIVEEGRVPLNDSLPGPVLTTLTKE